MYKPADTSKSAYYPLNGYPHGYGYGTDFIFIQRRGHRYHTIRIHRHPFTSLTKIYPTEYAAVENFEKTNSALLVK